MARTPAHPGSAHPGPARRARSSYARWANVSLGVALGALLLVQGAAGVWSASGAAVAAAAGLTLGTVLLAALSRRGRGLLPAFGLSAVAIGQALVVRTATPPVLLVLVLGVWLPAVSVGLALHDAANRDAAAPIAPTGSQRRWGPAGPAAGSAAGAAATPAPSPARAAVRSALVASVVVALLAAAAAAFLHPPGNRGGPTGRSAERFWERSARRGETPTSLGIYQSAQQLDVGRRVELSDQVVLRVDADAPDFWRGTTYDVWDGRSWTRTEPTSPSPAEDGDTRGAGDGGDAAAPGGAGGAGDAGGGGVTDPGPDTVPPASRQTFVQVVTVVAGGSDLLFGAYQPVQVLAPQRVRIDFDGTAALREPLGPGARYTVVSSRPVVTADDLRRADPLGGDLPHAIAQRYLQLPPMDPAIARLARDVAGAEPTTYDRVQALERWMGANTTYTLDIPPLPDGADAVEQFLFVDRRGYCEQIATSLTVMLRSLGVPARLGVGYAPGERSWGSDAYEVRGTDAHVWVEVWFPGVGWQAFDPTASVPLSGEPTDAGTGSWLRPLLVAAALTAAGAGAVLLVARRRHRTRRPWEALLLDRLEDAGRRRGRPRRVDETLAEYARALGRGVLADDRLEEVAQIVARSRFAPGGVDAEEQRRACQLVDEVLAAAGRAGRGPPRPALVGDGRGD